MSYKYDLSIIIPTCRPAYLQHILYQIYNQSADGISYEIIIVQESNDGFSHFNITDKIPINNITIRRQKIQFDYGAKAKDIGLESAKGQYVAFWDDDNVYYNHAITSLYLTAVGHDVGIVQVKHCNMLIPIHSEIIPGDIDTMCLCVSRELALKEKWADNCGRYSDYRWIKKLMKHSPTVNHSKVIIGQHL